MRGYDKWSQADDAELAYHERCRAVAKALGVTLRGSSINAGFSTVEGDDISHAMFVKLEKLTTPTESRAK